MSTDTEQFGFVLLDGYPLAALASAVDVLALANYVSEKPLYAWTTLSTRSNEVVAMNGVRTRVDCLVADAPKLDAIMICSGLGGARHDDPSLTRWLQARHAQGARVGAVSTGSWLLARAGLLHERRCTVHWEDLSAFEETFPDAHVTSEIFEIDARVFTCSGGSAALDMFIRFVTTRHGFALATKVADQLVHGPARSDDTDQRIRARDRLGIRDVAVTTAIEMMESNIESPLSVNVLAQRVGVSRRQLERLFRKHLGRTPQLYYREVRLARARSLLRGTRRSMTEIALASGFSSCSYFSKCYAERYGSSPSEERMEHGTSATTPPSMQVT